MSNAVLIIEDDFDTRTLIVELLESEGFAAEGAGSGTDALEMLKNNSLPNYIFLDISIPGVSSAELMEYLNSRPDRNQVKVTLASGWDDLHIRSREMGADGFIKKPLDINKILKVFS